MPLKVNRTMQDKGRKAVSKLVQELEHVEVVYVPVGAVRPNSYNPNRQDEHEWELLRRSMAEDGFTTPILVNRDGVIVDGEHRWRCATELGYEEIPVIYVDMSAVQAQISTLRMNRARGTHDLELTVQVLRELRDMGALAAAMGSLLLEDDYVSMLLDEATAPVALAGDQFSEAWKPVPAVDVIPQQQEGSVRVAFGEAARQTSTEAVQQVVQAIQKRIELAQSDPERRELKQQMQSSVTRISLTFSGEQAPFVKSVLEPHPAAQLLSICREYWRDHGKAIE